MKDFEDLLSSYDTIWATMNSEITTRRDVGFSVEEPSQREAVFCVDYNFDDETLKEIFSLILKQVDDHKLGNARLFGFSNTHNPIHLGEGELPQSYELSKFLANISSRHKHKEPSDSALGNALNFMARNLQKPSEIFVFVASEPFEATSNALQFLREKGHNIHFVGKNGVDLRELTQSGSATVSTLTLG